MPPLTPRVRTWIIAALVTVALGAATLGFLIVPQESRPDWMRIGYYLPPQERSR